MAKIVDITDKLDFEGNPVIKVRDQEFEVQADAATVLKLMGALSEGEGPKQILDMYDLIFDAKTRKKVDALKLQFNDLKTLIMTAISLVTGADEEVEGE
ncbi:hypothetical protein M2454_002938 [Aequitasia blattaphilus]|uniref:Tail assembly chaperone n=1 Tax=Aequitasia blattaphilus TaxID=2949332 RepID=A0ABT1EGL2_9FIRM|nr:hypothetical protein [Aequitasia blattaphilus]MCP1103597.1 hypothetical protein [Aequitasia blattaphilus]MCR8616237.1 hypothetical protein [Aequitasia blattaphilus]